MARKDNKKGKEPEVVAEAVEVEEVVEGGMGIDDGLVLTTSLLLGVAIALMFFAGQGYTV